MLRAWTKKSKTVLWSFRSLQTTICKKPILMFALGVLATVATGRLLDEAYKKGIAEQKSIAGTSYTSHRYWNDNLAKPMIVLSGVNGEAFSQAEVLSASIAPNFSFNQPDFQSAEILLPKKLQIGDILKLSANSGAVFSFKVARLAALCSADPSRQPVPDVALMECADRERAEQWRYVIEAVNEPARETQKISGPRSL